MNEAELLFTELLGCSRLELYRDRHSRIRSGQAQHVCDVLKRRIQGEPFSYIMGKTEFMGLEFRVTPAVLIPRPETELLVETVARYVKARMSSVASAKILDVGTGSGCIAVALAKLFPRAQVTATDISEEALGIAKQNAGAHDVRIVFIQSDVVTHETLRNTQYDCIVSNPPYIPTAEIARLESEVRHEPRIALDAGADGLKWYRRIITEAPAHLGTRGLLALEMGFGQRKAVKNILQNSGNFEIIEVVKDYNQIDRVIVARKKN